jgi:hypothetical protein
VKSLRNLLKNWWFIFAIALYLAALVVLSRQSEFSLSEALIELAIFGFAFPLLAWLTTRRAKRLAVDSHPTGTEMLVLAGYILVLAFYLAFGLQAIDSWLPPHWIASERIRFLVVLGKKLVVFVVLPVAIFGGGFRCSLRNFGFQSSGFRELFRSHLPLVLISCCAILIFQYFLGGGAAPLREGKFSATELWFGLPLCLLWLIIETGLVEEFPGAGPNAPQRLVSLGNNRYCFNGTNLWIGARARIHLSARGRGRGSWRESIPARCDCVLHRYALYRRHLLRRCLGAHQKYFRANPAPRSD